MVITDIFTRIDIEKEKLNVREDSIHRLLGYDSTLADPYVTETINNCISTARIITYPKSGFVIKKIKDLQKEGLLKIDDVSLNIRKIIAAHLKDSEFIAIFFATIGKEIEQRSGKEFQEGNMLEGYIYNLIGSETAESAAEQIHRKIGNVAIEAGLQITNRFSPGYCGWNVQDQFKLFSLFPDSFNDVVLTDSALMNPVKSVSGIIGLGEKARYDSYSCKVCNDDKCLYREKQLNKIN